MARHTRGQRDHNLTIARELDSLLTEVDRPLVPFSPSPLSGPALMEIEDRRTFHPERDFRPARSLTGYSQVKIYEPQTRNVRKTRRPKQYLGVRGNSVWQSVGQPTKHRGEVPKEIGFRDVNRVAVCIRRKRRKEVLFAKRKTRRGAGSRRHFNRLSEIRC